MSLEDELAVLDLRYADLLRQQQQLRSHDCSPDCQVRELTQLLAALSVWKLHCKYTAHQHFEKHNWTPRNMQLSACEALTVSTCVSVACVNVPIAIAHDGNDLIVNHRVLHQIWPPGKLGPPYKWIRNCMYLTKITQVRLLTVLSLLLQDSEEEVTHAAAQVREAMQRKGQQIQQLRQYTACLAR